MAPSGEPVAYDILADIKSTLEAITAGSDYYYTLERVEIGDMHPQDLHVFPSACITMGRISSDVPGAELSQARVNTMDVQVIAYLSVVDNPERDVSRLNRDIDQALLVDVTRSSNAVITRVVGTDPFYPVDGEPYCGAIIDVEVEFRNEHDDLNAVV